MKSDRKKAILDIVSKYEVDTQETLQALLLERGFNVTQATVSRDIKELSLLKTMSPSGSYKYSLPPPILMRVPPFIRFSRTLYCQ